MTDTQERKAPTLTPVDDLPVIERQNEARVAGPLIEDFLMSDAKVVKVDGLAGKPGSTKAIVMRYALTRKVPVKAFVRDGGLYLKKLTDEELASEIAKADERATKRAAKATENGSTES